MIMLFLLYVCSKMDLPIPALSGNCEVRAVISFLCAEGNSVVDIHHHLCMVSGGNVIPACIGHEWVGRFCDKKRTNIHDEAREPGSKIWMAVRIRVVSISWWYNKCLLHVESDYIEK